MPHLRIEYSGGLEPQQIEALCRAAHGAMTGAGIFPLAGIRIRAFKADFAIIADDDPRNDFVAMTLMVGAGRSTEALAEAGGQIFAAAQEALASRLAAPHFALSLVIREIDPALSWKDTPIHARLSQKD